MSNITIHDLTQEQENAVNTYAAIVKQIRSLEASAKALRPEIDAIVADADPEDTISFSTRLYKMEFSKASDSLKLSVPIQQLLEDTNNYKVVSVSITECKKQLSNAQLSQYFNVEKGSRRLSVL